MYKYYVFNYAIARTKQTVRKNIFLKLLKKIIPVPRPSAPPDETKGALESGGIKKPRPI